MKESITKFDLESAFKALDEIEIPVAGKIKANRPVLTEIFSRKTKLDSLMEEYYDISDTAELDDAKEAREAEVAKAKLARIEKIVDLEADSPEDLLTSYVGKYIMQCPQCMTLFYKNQEDIVESEDDASTVNVGEVCQHCGNESGYTLVGKVGEAEPGEFTDETQELEIPEAEVPEEVPSEETMPEEGDLEDLGDLDGLDLDLDAEEDKKEESFTTHEGEALVEGFEEDTQLDAKLEAHSEYIEYLRSAIAQEEQSLEKATNEQIKIAIKRNIDAYKADLESALPEAVKNNTAVQEEPVVDNSKEATAQEESYSTTSSNETLTENLHEETDLEVSAEEFEELIDSPEFKKPISDSEVRTLINDEKEAAEEEKQLANESFDSVIEGLDEIQESALETLISNSLVESYGNVAGFRLAECAYTGNKFTVDGTIYFTSGNTRKTTYAFTESCKAAKGKISLRGVNEKLGTDKQFILTGRVDNKTLITESFSRNK